MWIAILIISILALILGITYMMFKISHIPFILKLSKDKRGLSLFISLLIILIFLVIMSLITTVINSAVIFLHLILFTLIFSLLVRILKRVFKLNYPAYSALYLAVLFSIAYLLTAFYLCKNVWPEYYKLTTDKETGSIRIALLADSHLGTTFNGEGFSKLLVKIESESPDLLVIPGDFVDDSTTREDMVTACSALGSFKCKYGVYFAYGNHDRGYSRNEASDFREADLISELEKNGVTVLKDDHVLLDNRFYVVGREDASYERADIDTLLSGLDTDKYIIVLDHQPNDYENEANSSADLVLSGHTHGGQLFPITYLGELMGANDNTYGYKQINKTDFIVTSGISDWAIIFKTGTKSEYVIINID